MSQVKYNAGPSRGVIWGAGGPSLPQGKRKKERKKEKEKRKREKRKKGTVNSVKLLHIKCCLFQFFNSPVALKNLKNVAPQEKVEMMPLGPSVLLSMNQKLCHLNQAFLTMLSAP